MNKQFGFAKRFKKELIDEMVQDNVQDTSSSQRFENVSKALDGNSEQVLKNNEKE